MKMMSANMKRMRAPYIKRTFENLHREALKYTTRGKFKKGSPSAYQSAIIKDLLDQICSHMLEISNKPRTDKELHQEALKYTTRGEFKKNSPSAHNVACRRDILDQICGHMKIFKTKWTDEKLHREALKYPTRIEFQKNSHKAYDAAGVRGILDQICGHMEYICYPWTNQELHQEALKYKTRGEFQKNSPSAYSISLRRGVLNQVCSRMKPSRGSSNGEKELLAAIKIYYPIAKSIRDKKVKIEDKPYIKGFDIDIFVLGVNKGIEFDGKYYHSTEGLKRGRPHWPAEDLLNYHTIKDTWFATKGIQILHIKEEDWIKDREACIKHCLDFLENEEQKAE
jgi:hypothetical protein